MSVKQPEIKSFPFYSKTAVSTWTNPDRNHSVKCIGCCDYISVFCNDNGKVSYRSRFDDTSEETRNQICEDLSFDETVLYIKFFNAFELYYIFIFGKNAEDNGLVRLKICKIDELHQRASSGEGSGKENSDSKHFTVRLRLLNEHVIKPLPNFTIKSIEDVVPYLENGVKFLERRATRVALICNAKTILLLEMKFAHHNQIDFYDRNVQVLDIKQHMRDLAEDMNLHESSSIEMRETMMLDEESVQIYQFQWFSTEKFFLLTNSHRLFFQQYKRIWTPVRFKDKSTKTLNNATTTNGSKENSSFGENLLKFFGGGSSSSSSSRGSKYVPLKVAEDTTKSKDDPNFDYTFFSKKKLLKCCAIDRELYLLSKKKNELWMYNFEAFRKNEKITVRGGQSSSQKIFVPFEAKIRKFVNKDLVKIIRNCEVPDQNQYAGGFQSRSINVRMFRSWEIVNMFAVGESIGFLVRMNFANEFKILIYDFDEEFFSLNYKFLSMRTPVIDEKEEFFYVYSYPPVSEGQGIVGKKETAKGGKPSESVHIFKFSEKTVQTKIEFLLQKYEYETAYNILHIGDHSDKLRITKTQALFHNEICQTIKEHGDHLFLNGKYDEAIQKYLYNPLETDSDELIIDPSVVIEKFLQKGLLSKLSDFLIELHRRCQFNSNHTRLLLHCYIKSILFNDSGIKHHGESGNSQNISTSTTWDEIDGLEEQYGIEDEDFLKEQKEKTRKTESCDKDYSRLEEFVREANNLSCDLSIVIESLITYGFRNLAYKTAFEHKQHSSLLKIEIFHYIEKDFAAKYQKTNEESKVRSVTLQNDFVDQTPIRNLQFSGIRNMNFRRALLLFEKMNHKIINQKMSIITHDDNVMNKMFEDLLSDYVGILIEKIPLETTNFLIRYVTGYMNPFASKTKALIEGISSLILGGGGGKSEKEAKEGGVFQLKSEKGYTEILAESINRDCEIKNFKSKGAKMVQIEDKTRAFSFFNFTQKKKNFFVNEIAKLAPEHALNTDQLIKYFHKNKVFDNDEIILPTTTTTTGTTNNQMNCENEDWEMEGYKTADYFMYWLLVFLENVICRVNKTQRQDNSFLSVKCFNTLLELYFVFYKKFKNRQTRGIRSFYSKYCSKGSINEKGKRKDDEIDIENEDSNKDNFGLTNEQEIENQFIKTMNYSITDPLPNLNIFGRIKLLLGISSASSSSSSSSYFVDLKHALILILKYNIEESSIIEYVYNELGLKYDLLNYYKKTQNYAKVYELTCEKFQGKTEPTMFIQTLNYFVGEYTVFKDLIKKQMNSDEGNVNEDYETKLSQIEINLKLVLDHLKKNDIIPPLRVINILSKSKEFLQMKLVKSYLKSKLFMMEENLREYENIILSFKNQTTQKEKDIIELTQSGTIIGFDKCHYCKEKMKPPIRHFMCGHSFHSSCIAKNQPCPICIDGVLSAVDNYKKYVAATREVGLEKKHKMDKFYGLGLFKKVSNT